MGRQNHLFILPLCAILCGCSTDPDTFVTYTQKKNSGTGKINATKDPQPTDALAFNYANSVEEIFRARSTGARYTNEASNTALTGLSVFSAAAESLSIGASTISTMGLAGAGVLQIGKIFDAPGRANAYFEAAQRIHGAIKDFRAHNLNNVSEQSISPNGWTLANVVGANIDIVDKILNGHLPTPDDLTQASEPMTDAGAFPQKTGSQPANNIPAPSLVSPAFAAALNKPARQPQGVSSTDLQQELKKDAPPPPPLPGLPTPAEFGTSIGAIDGKMPTDKKDTFYANMFKAAGISIDDPVFQGLGANLKPNFATLSEAYSGIPKTRPKLSGFLDKLKKDPLTDPTTSNTP